MKKFKGFIAGAVAAACIIPSSNAFFIGTDKYTKEEYADAGIAWEHNWIYLDRYYYNGQRVYQAMAEKITQTYHHSKNFAGLDQVSVDTIRKLMDLQVTDLKEEFENLKKEIENIKKTDAGAEDDKNQEINQPQA